MKYEDLPEEIKAIVPKNRFGSAHKCQNGDILLYTNYSNTCDHWVKKDGKYQFQNS